jgi:hypothetical protein
MSEILTPEEEKIIKRIESSGNRDHLLYGLAFLVPCFIIIGIGAWFSKMEVVGAGAFTYCLFYILMLVRQDKMTACLRSAVEKLRKKS